MFQLYLFLECQPSLPTSNFFALLTIQCRPSSKNITAICGGKDAALLVKYPSALVYAIITKRRTTTVIMKRQLFFYQ